MQSSVGDEEEHQGAVAAVDGTFEEGLLTEVQIQLTRNVELRMLETPHVVHVLTSRGRRRETLTVWKIKHEEDETELLKKKPLELRLK